MVIGIVSDSHGKYARLKAALDVFAARGVDTIVHCGDIGSADCMEMLGHSGVDVYAISGNMDRHVSELSDIAAEMGINFGWEVIKVPIGDDKYLVATHGEDERLLGELLSEQQFPYLCYGHTHRKHDQKHGNTRLINPGALHHAKVHTVAILDTATDTLEFVELLD